MNAGMARKDMKEERTMPAWLNKAVFYQIYPQSYKDTDADGIGDIQGIIESLPYIASLGCNAIWMDPCFDSPFADAGYDVRNYKLVAPRYGTNADLQRLFREAHARGMHVILDLVPGHTSIDHPWFKASCRPEKNEFSGRYIWTDSIWKDMRGIENIAGVLRGISDRDGSVATNFFSTQPALNYGFVDPKEPWQSAIDSPEAMATREAMVDVMRFWLSMGADGFRVDMAGSLIKGEGGRLKTIELWKDVRAFLDREFPEAAIISEWGMPSEALEGGFHMDFLLANEHSHYNELFRTDAPFFSAGNATSAEAFVEQYEGFYAQTGGKGLICIPSGNHDTPRVRDTLTPDEMRLMFAFLLTMPGAPFIYYGDEIGMRYIHGLTSVEGGYHRTGTRTPMQWDKGPNAGFSAAPPEWLYIAIDPDPERPDVRSQMEDMGSLWHTVRALNELRAAHPALQADGSLRFLDKGEKALAYERVKDGERVVVAIAPKAEGIRLALRDAVKAEELFSLGGKARLEDGELIVPGRSAYVMRLG